MAEECAIANRGSDHGRRGTDVERRRKLAAVRYPEEAVVVIATVGEGNTTGGVDEHAIEAEPTRTRAVPNQSLPLTPPPP